MRLFGLEINIGKSFDAIREDLVDMQRQLEDIGWIKINYGDYGDSYSLTKESYDRMVQRSRLAFIKNPIVAQAINLTTWYTFGDGMGLPRAQDEEVQQIVTDFWKHPDNKISFTSPPVQLKLSNKLQFDGELALMLQVDTDGSVYVRVIDPITIQLIVSDGDDRMRPLFYKRKVQMRDQYIPDWSNGLAFLRDEMPSEWAAMLKRFDIADADVMKTAYMCHVKSNNDILDPRGIPDVYRALDWMNANSKINSDCASFINAQAQYAWKKKLTGTKTQIEAMAARQRQNTGLTNPSNMPGSTYVHNDKVEMEAIGLPGSSGTLFETGIRRSLLMMCAAFGIMEHYFGDPSTGNLATSKSMELPMLKKFKARQKQWEGIYEDVLQFQLDMKLLVLNRKSFDYNEMKNRLTPHPARDYKNRNVAIHFPPILEKDIKDMAEAMSKAKSSQLIPIETARREFMGALNIDDIDEEMKKEFEQTPEAVPPGGAPPFQESVRSQGKSIQASRETALKLADKNKQVLGKLNGYKTAISEAYTGLVRSVKSSLVMHAMPSGKFEAHVQNLDSHLKVFEQKMLSASSRYYPQVIEVAERYAKSKIQAKVKEAKTKNIPLMESALYKHLALLEGRMDNFIDDRIAWNGDYVKKSLGPYLKSKFDAVNGVSFITEADALSGIDDVAAAGEARVAMYVGGLWSTGEKAVVEALKGTDSQANFVGVEDDHTCTGCQEALDGNPYPLDDCPVPGDQDCGPNCRHAIQVIDSGDENLTENDIQLLKDAEDDAKNRYHLLKEIQIPSRT